MDNLKEIQNKLKARASYHLHIIDVISGSVFQKGIDQTFLDENHKGSLPEYLVTLKAKGYQKVQLMPRLKNGSSSKPAGATVTVDFTQNNQPTNTGQSITPPHTQSFGLNGAMGLGMPEIMDGYAAKRENEMLKEQLRQLQADFKEEKEKKSVWRDRAEKAERKNERFSYKEDIQREPSSLDKLIDGLAQNPSAIPALIGAFKGSGGLNAPQPQQTQIINPIEGYTDWQKQVVEMLQHCPDNFCEEIANLITRVSEGDKKFINELQRLLETPNLKKVENDG